MDNKTTAENELVLKVRGCLSALGNKNLLDGDIKDIIAALLPSAPAGWMDIKDAPKDGTEILAYWSESAVYSIIAWYANKDDKDGGYWLDETEEGLLLTLPTHWMPLPQPPEEQG